MRLFGILLIFFCLVAGGAYVYFGLQDYKGRQETNARVLRHLILLQGLPVEGADAPADEAAFEVRLTTGESSKTISKKLLENYFKDNAASPPPTDTATAPAVPLGGTEAVANQTAELKRVRALIKSELEKVKDAPAQKAALLVRMNAPGTGIASGGWLLLHAETMNERIQYLEWAAPTTIEAVDEKTKGQERAKTPAELADDAESLAHALDRKFYRVAPKLYDSAEDALSPTKWTALQEKIASDPAARPPVSTDDADRRARLAHLLVHLDRDSAWQKRVAVVVGLRRYVGAVATQASRFREMRTQVELPVPSDQANFQKGQDALINEALIQSARARDTAEAKNRAESQLVSAKAAVEQRQTQIDDLEASLKKVRAEVDQLLIRQTGVETDLFEIQREVSLTLEEVYRLEALLIETERERYGLSPRR